MTIDKFIKKKEEKDNSKYPIIWKVEECKSGECKGDRTRHRWSVPSVTPMGSMTECFECHKSRLVIVTSDPNVWLCTPGSYSRRRLAELKMESPNLFQ